jgi:hypothetical protein
MSTLGKICLSLTLLLLLLAMAPIPGIYGGWAPKLLVFHNQWSEKLRDAKAGAIAATEARATARQELSKASTDIENLVTGWDRYWNIPRRGPQVPQNAPSIRVENGQLILANIGTNNGLVTRQVTDENGAQQLMLPVVHAFYGGPEGFAYAGEFIATQAGLTPTSATLIPVHPVAAQDIAKWPAGAAWRLRGMIPSGNRTSIDELYRRLVRTYELMRQTDANIARQEGLKRAAEEALGVREGELLGNPDGIVDPDRPEFVVGLLQAIEDFEEERNQLQLDVDHLRRSLKASSDERNQKLEGLAGAATKLPGTSPTTSLESAKVTGQPVPAN